MVLPVIVRELRVRARSGAIVHVRMAAAGLFMLMGGFVLVPMAKGVGLNGAVVLAAMGWMLMLYVLFEGARIASSVISEERRDGTLGLLFLTDLTALDVLLGKLAGAAVTAFYSLLAMVPVLSVALLLGGVTWSEVARGAMSLMLALALSLSAGLWASARSREGLMSFLVALGVVMGLTMVPLLVEMVIRLVMSKTVTGFEISAGLFSPLATMVLVQEASYRGAPVRFWVGLGAQTVVVWGLVFGAARSLRHSWREEIHGGTSSRATTPVALVDVDVDGPSGSDPRLPPVLPLPAASLSGVSFETGVLPGIEGSTVGPGRVRPWAVRAWAAPEVVIGGAFGERMSIRFWQRVLVGLALVANLPQWIMAWVAAGAGVRGAVMAVMGLFSAPAMFCALGGLLIMVYLPARAVGESRYTGELEILLTTPLGHVEYLEHLWLNLRGVSLWLTALTGVTTLFGQVSGAFASAANAGPSLGAGWVAGMMAHVLVATAGTWFTQRALVWSAFWFALRMRKLSAAVGMTFGLVGLFTPVLTSAVAMVLTLAYADRLAADGGTWLVVLHGVIAWVGPLAWCGWAKARLRRSFREVASGSAGS